MDLCKTYRASLCAIGAALSILLFVSGAEAANLIDSCTTISQPGEYILSQNIINSTFSSCINITSSNVVLDGSGFTIDGIDTWYTYGVYVYNSIETLTNVTVRNLVVTDWYYGIYSHKATNGIIENNKLTSNSYYGIYLSSSNNNILNVNNVSLNYLSEIYAGGSGILLELSINNTLTNNIASLNEINGISLQQSSNNNTLINNDVFSNGADGIFLVSSNNNILTNNNAGSNGDKTFVGESGTAHGIYLLDSDNNTLNNNNASSNLGSGIKLYSSSNNTLTGNNMSNNSANFYLEGYEYWDLNNSIDSSNIVDSRPIFYIKNARDTIYDSKTNAGTFYCIWCDNVTIRDLNVSKNYFGIVIWFTNNSNIENINASSNSVGISLNYYNNNNTITNNKGSANGVGIYIGSNNNNNILTNNSASVNLQGILLGGSNKNNTLINNNASLNYQGIVLGDSNKNNTLINNKVSANRIWGIGFYSYNNNNIIINNNVSANNIGFIFYDEDNNNNTLINNNVSSNSNGIILGISKKNIIYHNNFINNTNQSFDDYGSNLWDLGYPGGGNYWSDYNGTDINNDGIGDTPYNTSGGMQDKYPFMKMTGWMPQQTATAIPGFETLWVIFSVVIVFFLKRIQF